jgi:hypothetical protein
LSHNKLKTKKQVNLKMKKIIFLFAIAVMFSACTQTTTEATTVDSTATTVDSITVDTVKVTVDTVTTVKADSTKK